MDIIKFSRSQGLYGCFSNFAYAPMEYNGLHFDSSEAAWQAQKCTNSEDIKQFCNLSASAAKRLGRSVTLRKDWEDVKYDIMVEVLKAKFTQNQNMLRVLLSTQDKLLVEDTTGWHDNIWGSCSCPRCAATTGKNLLGKALMQVRSDLK